MKFSVARALGLVSLAALPSISALDLLPNHAHPKMLTIPPKNVTVITPRITKSSFDQQLFDFGSAQSSFSELRRVFERQSACSTGYGSCPNDPGTCCQIGGRCCGGERCCGAGSWCYADTCCLNTDDGCDDKGCCGKDQQCCKGGKCCESGNNCVIVQGQLGCCPIGETCGPRTCQDAGYSPCADFDFCCLTGYQCYRDNEGNAKCRDPNPPPPPTSSYTPPESSYVSVPPTTEEEGSTYEPPPQPTVTVVTTQTQVFTTTRVVPTTQTMQPNNPSVNRPTSSGTSSTIQAAGTGAILGSQTTKTSTGAIAGGVAAGVVAIVVLVIILIVWRRRKGNETSTAGASPAVHNAEHHEPGAIPPTPGSGNPFLTPMGQNQNFGVSYFNGVPPPSSPAITAPSGSNSGIGPYNASQYSGLPEPQQNSMGGTGVVMPQPRYDSTHPHPLPMTIVHSQRPQSSDVGNVARPWSAYTPSPGINAAPYAESNNSQPSAWAAQTNNSTSPPPQTGYANPPYADYSGPGRPASTVYQPSSHVAYSPPGSPALPEVYGGMVGASGSGSGSGLPPGAAPPVNVYRSDEKKSYVPYQ